MKKNLFICGTGTDVGKTYTTLSLIESLSNLGLKVGIMKPIETGVKNTPQDATILFEKAKKFNPALNDLRLSDICPISFTLPAAPAIAKGAQQIDFDLINKCHKAVLARCDIVLIEGAGGLLTPIEQNYFMLNLAEMLNSRLLLVSHARLGCINDIMLNKKVLEPTKLEFLTAINKRIDDLSFDEISLPYLKSELNDLFILPNDLDKLAYRIAS